MKRGLRLFAVLIGLWLVGGGLLSWLSSASPEEDVDPYLDGIVGHRGEWPAFVAAYERSVELLRQDSLVAALATADTVVALGLEADGLPPEIMGRAYAMKALLHARVWQYVDAEQALKRALRYAEGEQTKRLVAALREVDDALSRNNEERGLQKVYAAERGLGPAGRLRGKVLIAYVFIDDGDVSRWSLRRQRYVLTSLDRVERWWKARAREYGVTGLSFTRRVFQYAKDPLLRNAIRRLDARETALGYDVAERVVRLEGATSVNAFLRRLAREEGADQALLLLHADVGGRSYAMVSIRPEVDEYAYLLHTPDRNVWEGVERLQAHEALHLFGADDLYNLEGARTYAPRDVMHYRSRFMAVTEVAPITAYAIGWTNVRPATPFPVHVIGDPE